MGACEKADMDKKVMCCPGKFLSALFLIAIIKFNPKLLLLIGIAWPVLSSDILYIVPVNTAVYIICAIYCIVLLVCLGCCQRAGAGRDIYDFEAESDDDDNEIISESRISIE
ncbi:Protein CBG25347 [Caenorhabditis briggsae]|uniref:Protein CBG25347 n=1 Tax=Caenorhabditis briggsae TaxID=6238 RepID=B6IIL1_CAEBR|nr:Protein CBG25347 [Caenorhabditis briggsae]CAR99741.1 Protein CBG25347 [Caenorhabditis briggsae]